MNSTDETTLDAMIEKLDERGDLDREAFRAYAELIGVEYVTLEGFEEAYAGYWRSPEEFAENMADSIGAIDANLGWPYSCIDWTHAARELMFDYMEESGYYFRQL